MGDEFATADTEADTAPGTDSAASPTPLPLPEGAEPVAAVTGYHALIKGGAVTVFGPDGAEIASARRASGYDSAIAGRVGDTRLVADGIGDGRLTSFAELAARHHWAVADPGLRDRVWVRWEEDGVAAVFGTVKYDDDDLRAVKAGNLYWSGQRQAWATGRPWKPGTRDLNIAAVLKAFARQDRNIVVLGPGQTPEDLPASPTPAAVAAAAVPAQQASPAAAPSVTAPEPAPEPEPEPEDLTGLSYEDLVAAEDVADTERSRRWTSGAPAAEARYQRLRLERGKRLLDRVATAAPVTELGDEDLAAEREWWQKTIHKTPFHSADESYRTLERRRNEVTVEQNGRTARALMAGPAAADLDDEALESAFERIGPSWTRLPGGTELSDQVTAYRTSLQDERVTRRARSYSERTPVGEMTLEELIAESTDLGSHLAARNEQSTYSYSEAVKDARAERLRVVDAEWHQRGLEQNPDAARAALGRSIGGKLSVLIDGAEQNYGYVERQGKKFRALTSYDQRSGIGDFDSGPAAMAALVRRYDKDPETLPRRTWGNEREVDLPSSSYDPLVSWLRNRPSELSREYDRVLTLLTPYEKPTQTKVLNPLTNQIMRAYPFHFEEGLLGELARIAERTTEDLREQSLNEQLPKREREAAKRRIPAMGAALIGINAVIEQVRAAGGDVERRGVDQGRLAAQMAALAGTVDEREGGESDDGEQPVRDAAAAALGGVPAPGAGGDGEPGPALPDAGDADERGNRRGGGGPGGGTGAGDGVPGPGRADGADLGDGAGAGPARDAAAAGGRGGPGGAAESGSGGAGGNPQGAGEPVATRRFRPDPADLPRGPFARAEANLVAIKVLRALERENRGTTVDEARALARWSGWGSVPTVFLDEPDPDEPIYGPGGDREGGFETDHATWESYSRVRGELRDLLDPFEWRAASRAVLSAHYTPQVVAESMWQGLAAYGFDGGEVLEAGCGSGAFFGVAPPAARLTGVELDPTTAAIAGRIYPHANVLAESFTDTDVPLATFDAVIGNVPFAQAPFGERRYRAGGHSLHNGFIIKQLALLRPGAYMAVITSRWTLDGEDTAARRDMSRWGDLAAAYRLPKGTFGETADTDVVADVLVFRRRAEGEEPRDLGWIEAPERELGGNAVTVNAYFTEHPEHVLGRLTTETGPYGPRVTVQGDPGQAPGLLRERMEATAAAAVADGLGYVHHEDWPHREPLLLQTARLKHATDFTGRLYVDDQQRIWQHVNGADPVRVITADGVSGTEQLRMLLSLRDVAGELQELDRTGQDPDRAREVRDQLARLHASYTAKHGPLSRPRQTRLALPGEEAAAAARDAGVDLDGEDRLPTGWGWFRQDPHAAVVLGLEHWDRANDRAVNSEVLTRRPGARRGDLEPTDDPKTALTAVMGATGRVDLPLIASLLGTTADEARARLGTEVFDNPVAKKLEHAGAYLSGAVREKLEQARGAAATDPKYAVNVAALEVVQPPPKRLGQFTAQLGAHWIPAPLVQGFLREYLGDPTLQVSHNERYGWSLAAGKVPDAINALKGTERRSAVHIAKALLGRASTVVNQLDGSGVDEDATRAMRYKADAMRSAFEDYCTASTARVTQLTDAYNRQMNGHVVRSYDSLAPTLEGFTTERTPHPWQLSGAARMQFERGVILAHEMGLGKTTTMVMGSQALKASGQIGKPFAVVQPGLGRQWLDEAKLLYPNADIHLITSDDLADGNRRPVLEWLRANSPDLVIFTEGAFGSIRMSPEQQELFIFRELESLKEQLERERGIPHNAFALMKLEQRLATVEARIRRNDAPMRTPGEVYWDDLGFDYACVDEAHRFTAVGFRSKEAGGNSASIRGVDLHQKLTWHHQMAEYNGGRPTVTLGTGTPMEHSIFEQYSCLELGTPWLLDQFGVHGPDLWSETFGQKVQRIEQAPDGSGLTIVERFSRFVSKSTMKTMWGLATDTKTGDEVGIERPKVAGGAPELVLVEPTADQRTRLQSLVVRGQAIQAGDVTRDEDNMLAVSGEGRAVALDPRLVDADAPAGNKLVEAADIIAAGYHAHKDHTYSVSSRDDTPHPVPGGLFFVFANSGTPGGNNKGNFDAYAELRDLLATRGVPPDMVQFAQEHRTPERKAEMTKAANNGGIAVLMGSSEVLGTGVNAQNRAYALMHLDQDWTPAMMMQRNARALRPGNQHEEVGIYFLATKGSMDAWQVGLLTSKAEGLRDIQRPPGVGDDEGDTVEEIGASDWDYATMAAEIGGNPYMKRFMEARVHLQGLEADRRNAAADRVRQTELLGTKEGELAGTRLAIAAREKALPKITETIRGDAFRIHIGGREFDRFGEAAPVLRQVVNDAVRAHQNEGRGGWKKLGTFGGLDFAVQPEIAHGSGEIRAYIGFPELRHSESRCSVEDLLKGNIGATMLGRLATALEKAEDHQLMDRERLPGLEKEVAYLTAQQEAVNYGPAIEHARRRVELLDGIVGAITERDKIPDLTESMLDPKKHPTESSRKKALQENTERRAPHQANVDAAAMRLTAFDAENAAPEPVQLVNTWTEDNDTDEAFEQWRERQRIIVQQNREAGLGAPISADEPAPVSEDGTADAAAAELAGASGEHTEGQAPEPESGGDSTEEPAAQPAEMPGDAEVLPAPAAEELTAEDVTTLFAPGEQVRVTPMSYDTWSKTYVPQPEFIGTVIGYTRNGNYRVLEPEHGTSNRHYDARRELHKLDPEPDGESTKGPAAETTEQPGDGYGTADLYDELGLARPERVPAPAPQDDPDPEAEEGESAGVPEGQMTIKEVAAEPAPAAVPQAPPADVEQQSEGPAAPETATGSGAVPTEDGRGAQLQAALIEGETIAPVSFTDRREPAAGWILTTAGGHTFRLRPVTYARPDEDQWEAGHDADGSYWWAANMDDRPLTAVLARIREDSATRTRFASLWAQYGHLTAQATEFETTTDRVQLDEGVYLVRRFGRIGLIASCRWGWEHLTDPDGAQGRTGEDWSRKGPDNRQYVAEWKIWHSAQDAIPNARLRVVAQLTDDMADTPDAYCDASQPYVGKCSAKRSGSRYTVAVDTDQGSELGCYTVCARCLSHRLLNDEDRHIGHRDVQSLVQALAKGDPRVGNLHWKQWPDRIAEVAGQMLSAALDAGEATPWPAQALMGQIIAEACEAGDDRAAREARAKVKAAGGDATAQKRAAEEAVAARQDRAALVARHSATHMEAANAAVATLGLAGSAVEGSNTAPEPAEEAPVVVDVNTLTASPQVRNGEPSSYAVVTPTLDDAAQPETAEAPAAAELPELDVVLLDVDVPPLDPAEPYDTDEEAQADIGRLGEAFARWDALPAVQRYYEADRQQRPDGTGNPTNPVAQLAAAYRDAEQSLRDGPAGSPDDLVRQVHTVAVWSGALEPVVGEDLRGPLGEVRETATLLASRSQATVEAFEAELAALSTNPAEESAAAETAPAEQIPVAVDDEPEAPQDTTEPGPGEPAAGTGPAEPPAATQSTTAPETDGVTDDDPAPVPQEAPEPPAAAGPPENTAADSHPEPRAPDPQEPAVAVPDEGMHEARREASFLEQDRPQPTDGDQQTPEPGTAAAPPEPDPDPTPASEDAPGDDTARDASEEPTMTTPPIPETTDTPAPDEQITEEPPAPHLDTAALAGDPDYRMRLSGLDGQPVDSGDVLRGDLVIATLHPGPEGGWFARLDAERLPNDVTYLVDTPQDAASSAAILYSAFTGAPYGPPPGAAVGDETRQRVDVLRADLRDGAVRHRNALFRAAAQAYATDVGPDFALSERFQALFRNLDGLAASVSFAHGSQQMTQYLDGVQGAINTWGGALPNDPGDPERQQMAFPLAHLLYDSRRMQDQVQATLAAMQAEREIARAEEAAAAVALNEGYLADYRAGRPPRDEAAAAAYREWQQLDAEDRQEALEARGPEDEHRSADADEVTAATTDTGPQQEGTESQSPEVPDSQSTDKVREEAPVAPAGTTADAPAPENAEGAAAREDGGPTPDAAVDAVRQALEDALRAADQPEPAAPEPGELPLWTGPEASPTDTAATEPPTGPMDVRAEFQAVLDAWDEHVPSVNGTAQDLVADLDADLTTLQRAFAEAVTPAAPAEPSPAATPTDTTTEGAAAAPVPQQVADVNSALQQADTHAAVLQDLPEWQKIQTVRGAVGHLFRVMRERAGEHFERLMGDNRVGEFFRKVSINACERVAGWAQAEADRLRRRGEEKGTDAPAADALRDVADAASAYSSPGGGRGGPPPASRGAASTTVDIPEMRQLGEALSRPLPGARDGRGTRVSTAAARGKSTTRSTAKKPSGSGKKKSGGSAEQAGHLRRGGTDQQGHKPTQR